MKRAFFFHYNKPASLQRKVPTLSIHTAGKCILVENIDCKVPTKTRIRKTSPKIVMCGYGKVNIKDNIATIC